MFDNFEPFKGIEKQNFIFQPSRYEIWIGGKMVDQGTTNYLVSARVIQLDGNRKMEVTFDDKALHQELAQSNVFDEFITAKDRLQLITIPAQTNVENMAIVGLKMILGATRQEKDFNRNEPYCCNLFLQKGTIVKVTFSYSNPEKLLEFYS